MWTARLTYFLIRKQSVSLLQTLTYYITNIFIFKNNTANQNKEPTHCI